MMYLLKAYWKTSVKRFVDNACQGMDRYEIFQNLSRRDFKTMPPTSKYL
jgi:hypothetical protein